MMIFGEYESPKPRKRLKRKERIFFHKLGQWSLLLVAGVLGGVLGAAGYDEFFTKREFTNLKQSVDNLRRDFIGPATRNPEPRTGGTGLAKTVTDSKGNVYDTLVVDLIKNPVKLYFKDDEGERLGSLQRLKEFLTGKGEELIFATNGGMYTPEGSPVGLLVLDSKMISPLDLKGGDSDGNFYLKPNGVFALTDKGAVVMESNQYKVWAEKKKGKTIFATQSGPMLITDGALHPRFRKDSPNGNVRSGVGIINSNQLVFVISQTDVNFYDFAMLFQQEFKCKNALYLDGVVSRMYLPALKRHDLDGDFGSIIAISK